MIINRTLHAVPLSPISSPTAWTIDPERTQYINTNSPAPSPFTIDPEKTQFINTGSPSPTPWSIDPNRTQQI